VDDLVVLDAFATQGEANLVCGILRDAGIECYDRPTNQAAGAFDGWTPGGSREVVIRAEDAEEARRVLEAQRS
jgi:hypothetical protein